MGQHHPTPRLTPQAEMELKCVQMREHTPGSYTAEELKALLKRWAGND